VKQLARKLESAEATQLAGHVARVEGDAFVVETSEGEWRARRAASCLLDPAPGDHVLFAALGDGRAFVLAVLERADAGKATATLDHDLAFRVPGGSFEVVAKDGVRFVSPGEVSIVSGSVGINAAEGHVGITRLTVLGREMIAESEVVKMVAGAVDSVIGRLSQRLKRSHRTVEEIEQLRARRVDYTAEKSMHLHAENALFTAKELVKLDGEHIHMG